MAGEPKKRIQLKIDFVSGDGATRSESLQVEPAHASDESGEKSLTHNIFSELKVAVTEYDTPRHNETARKWLNFPNKSRPFEKYFDIRNSQALWFELCNLVMRVESDLILAKAYKALEAASEPSLHDEAAINDLYYIQRRKMTSLDEAVYGLIKVQDLVNRLLHESLGGDLVDSSKPNWERTQLTRSNVMNGLKEKQETGSISRHDLNAINDALAGPKNTPQGEIARTYRNRLMHHIRPSVDYSMFFTGLVSRAGEEMKDSNGKIIGRRHSILSREPVQFRFHDLHAAFSKYLDAVVVMLQKLSEIDLLRQ